jgi:hypothetical protein
VRQVFEKNIASNVCFEHHNTHLSAHTHTHDSQAILEERNNELEQKAARISYLEEMLSELAVSHKQQSAKIEEQRQKIKETRVFESKVKEMFLMRPANSPG